MSMFLLRREFAKRLNFTGIAAQPVIPAVEIA
jgi:hypothetical protein